MPPLLSLEELRQIMGYNPWHFWGFSNAKCPINSSCNSLVKQYSWQGSDAAGRFDILESIQTAEERLIPYLGFNPAPRWEEITMPWPRWPKQDLARMGYAGGDGRYITEKLKDRGKIQNLGIRKLTLLGSSAVVFSDADGDGLKETFTLTVNPVTITDASEVAVYFQTADWLDAADDREKYRIRPIKASIVGNVLTITGKAWLLGLPVKYEVANLTNLDPDVAANFADILDVYREYNDPNGSTVDDAQATLYWEAAPYPYWSMVLPVTQGYDPAGIAKTIARVGMRDADLGIVYLGESVYDPVTGLFAAVPWYTSPYFLRPPDKALIRAKTGLPLVGGMMARDLATIVARFAAAELTRKICACDNANRWMHEWQFDLARSAGANDESYTMTEADLNNPFGTRRGQVFAWREVRAKRVLTGAAF